MKKYILKFCLLGLFLSQTLQAQDPQFTQFFLSPLYLNPALTGTTDQFRYSLHHRSQWLGVESSYFSTNAAAEVNVEPWRSAFGLMLQHDYAGTAGIQLINVTGSYSFLVPLKRWALRLGLQGSIMNRSATLGNLVFVSQVRDDEPDVFEGYGGGSIFFADFSAGALIYNRNVWLGVAAQHIAEPNQSLVGAGSGNLRRKYSVHAGANFDLNTINGGITLMPSVLFKMQGAVYQLDAGTRVLFEHFPVSIGTAYRGIPFLSYQGTLQQDAVAFMVGYEWNGFTFGYSYDLTISGLAPYSGGSHEIAVVYEHTSRRYRETRSVKCPIFKKKPENFR